MSRSIRITGVFRAIVFAGLGMFVGDFVAGMSNPLPLGSRSQVFGESYRIPKIPGGTPLRIAMVHDVIHERYLRHGTAWYTQRIADARKSIDQHAPAREAAASTDCLDAMDDLAIGLERTGQYDESISVLRKKLALVSPLPQMPASRSAQDPDPERTDLLKVVAAGQLTPLQHHQYTTCANLGTVLIHRAMPKALTGDTDAKSQAREGLDFIEKAIAINPAAHFGRETWQAIAIEALLADIEHPDLLQNYDLIGEPSDPELNPQEIARHMTARSATEVLDLSDEKLSIEQRLEVRAGIPRIGFEDKWLQVVRSDYSQRMPFDEPTMAILGMWTLGGGPNPHFALTLGRIMESFGQRSIAWNAYERAIELQEHFWPDPAIRAKLVAICRERENEIASVEDAANPAAWQDQMRKRHVAELAWGLAYQKAYQDFEASQITAGVPLDSSGFYSAFFRDRPSISSPPLASDDVIITHTQAQSLSDFLPCLMLGLGVGLGLAVIIPEKVLS